MQRIFIAAHRVEAYLLVDRLAHAGIKAHVFNEHASSIVGEVPPDVAQPQVWLDDRRRPARAPTRCSRAYREERDRDRQRRLREVRRGESRRPSSCAGTAAGRSSERAPAPGDGWAVTRQADAAMTGERETELGFAAAHDVPIPYLQRIRDYYQALGYGAPYEWAHYADVPFQPLASRSREMPRHAHHDGGAVSAGQGRSGSGSAVQRGGQVLHGLLGRHGDATTTCASRTSPSTASTRRPRTPPPTSRWRRCAGAAASGRIGVVAPRFHGAPTNRSHRVTLEIDCSGDRRALQGRRASMPRSWFRTAPSATRPSAWPRECSRRTASPPSSWAARRTSSSMSACRASCSPTSRSATRRGGRSDPASQAFTLDLALRVLETRTGPAHDGAIAAAWSASPDWKLDYSNIERLARGDRAPARRIRPGKAQARQLREAADRSRPGRVDPL